MLTLLYENQMFSYGALDILFLHVCRLLKVLASFLSPTAFALGSVNFADYERAHVGLRWSNIWRVIFFEILFGFLSSELTSLT